VSAAASVQRDAERLRVAGPLTMATVAAALQTGSDALEQGVRRIDLSQVSEVDSAAIALLLEWVKTAGAPLEIEGVPGALRKLARLYAVLDLLPFVPAAHAAEG
jgi:phospholipid transport system transporter-binding protein